MIFLLTTFLGLEQHIAQGVNLIFFIPTCIISVIVNSKNKNIKKQIAWIVSISGIIGAIIGTEISSKIHVKSLKSLFGYFLIIISIFEIYSFKNKHIKNKKVNNKNKHK